MKILLNYWYKFSHFGILSDMPGFHRRRIILVNQFCLAMLPFSWVMLFIFQSIGNQSGSRASIIGFFLFSGNDLRFLARFSHGYRLVCVLCMYVMTQLVWSKTIVSRLAELLYCVWFSLALFWHGLNSSTKPCLFLTSLLCHSFMGAVDDQVDQCSSCRCFFP